MPTHFLYFFSWEYLTETTTAYYFPVSIAGLSSNFVLSVGGYSPRSSAGDAFKDHNGMSFSAKDADNDLKSES